MFTRVRECIESDETCWDRMQKRSAVDRLACSSVHSYVNRAGSIAMNPVGIPIAITYQHAYMYIYVDVCSISCLFLFNFLHA